MLLDNKGINEEERALIATICWGIWKSRCDWVFNGIKVDAEKVINVATTLVREVWNARASRESRGLKQMYDRKLHWEAPEEGCIKINVDGAFLIQTGDAGIGVVCRDSSGAFVGDLSKLVEAFSAFEAKCVAVKEALLSCHIFSNVKVCIEVDCEMLYKAVTLKYDAGVEWQCASTLSETLALIETKPEVTFSLVSRQGNHAADFMAAAGSRKMGPNGWLTEAPSFLDKLLQADLVGGRVEENGDAEYVRDRVGIV